MRTIIMIDRRGHEIYCPECFTQMVSSTTGSQHFDVDPWDDFMDVYSCPECGYSIEDKDTVFRYVKHGEKLFHKFGRNGKLYE